MDKSIKSLLQIIRAAFQNALEGHGLTYTGKPDYEQSVTDIQK